MQVMPKQAMPSHAKSCQAKPCQAMPSHAKPCQAKPTQAKPSQAKPSQAKPNQAKPSQAKPVSAVCVSALCVCVSAVREEPKQTPASLNSGPTLPPPPPLHPAVVFCVLYCWCLTHSVSLTVSHSQCLLSLCITMSRMTVSDCVCGVCGVC